MRVHGAAYKVQRYTDPFPTQRSINCDSNCTLQLREEIAHTCGCEKHALSNLFCCHVPTVRGGCGIVQDCYYGGIQAMVAVSGSCGEAVLEPVVHPYHSVRILTMVPDFLRCMCSTLFQRNVTSAVEPRMPQLAPLCP